MGDSTVNYLTNRTKNLTKKVKMKFLLFSTFVILTAARTKRSADNGACAVFESTKATEKAKVVDGAVKFTYPKGVCEPKDNAKCTAYETEMGKAKTTAEARKTACDVFDKTKKGAAVLVVDDGVTFPYPKGVCEPKDNAKCTAYETTMTAAKTLAEKTQGVKIKEGVCGGSFALQLSVLLCFMYNLLK